MIFIALLDVLRESDDDTVNLRTVLSMSHLAKKVRIGDVALGEINYANPDLGQPNPTSITWTQEFEIVVHKIVGQKPLTQCTIPVGLWNCRITFNTLALSLETHKISTVLKTVRDWNAGPRKIWDSLWNEGKCMYLQKKEISQKAGSKDWYHSVTLDFIESNDGTGAVSNGD